MAKTPGPPKAKADAPAQFDMNHRERKGGKGRPGGRGRDEQKAPRRIVRLPPAVIDRGTGWVIHKIAKVDETSRAAMGAEYQLVFDGHEPLHFDYLTAARERAKEAPPEKPVAEEPA